MELADKIKLVKSWGFLPLIEKLGDANNFYIRSAPKGMIEQWSFSRDAYIDFIDSAGNLSHSVKIDWSLFETA